MVRISVTNIGAFKGFTTGHLSSAILLCLVALGSDCKAPSRALGLDRQLTQSVILVLQAAGSRDSATVQAAVTDGTIPQRLALLVQQDPWLPAALGSDQETVWTMIAPDSAYGVFRVHRGLQRRIFHVGLVKVSGLWKVYYASYQEY